MTVDSRSLTQFLLAEMYAYGNGVRQDHEEAVKWMRMSKIQGFRPAYKGMKMLNKEGAN